MKVALPVSNGRVSPVFDAAARVCVLDVKDGTIIHRLDHPIGDNGPVETLWILGVDIVICGAITRQLEAMLWVAGIEVVAEICGPVDMVIEAFLNGTLAEGAYFSPCHSNLSPEIRSPSHPGIENPRVRKDPVGGENTPLA